MTGYAGNLHEVLCIFITCFSKLFFNRAQHRAGLFRTVAEVINYSCYLFRFQSTVQHIVYGTGASDGIQHHAASKINLKKSSFRSKEEVFPLRYRGVLAGTAKEIVERNVDGPLLFKRKNRTCDVIDFVARGKIYCDASLKDFSAGVIQI